MSRVSVTLHFPSQEARDYFMGGLSDGFGEAHCALDWENNQSFAEASEFCVTVFHHRTGEPVGGDWSEVDDE